MALIEPIERLPIDGGDADAKLCVIQGRVGENRLNSISDKALGRRGVSRRLVVGCLRGCADGKSQKQGQEGGWNSPHDH